ncbi:protein of unknown function [Caloramator fervidus]|uniref:DUF3842 family protein n=1 Tax=Caloramator fervidus TaxID=29344 RepID=A0A1H5XY90_9CLOT|nr:DUF3842 family protein [Caloramator fervidus]SEG16505.1 protein of unknown function [Caloramator fervidus]
MLKIAVIDGQGAGIGRTFIKECKKVLKNKVYIFALGTNEVAANNMIKNGADEKYVGEKDIVRFLLEHKLDAIVGPIGILIDGGINGEITRELSNAIFKLDCVKYIIPLQKHGIYIPGTKDLAIKDIIKEIIKNLEIYAT